MKIIDLGTTTSIEIKFKLVLPPIEYLYGNTPFNNWIRNCKPFKPSCIRDDVEFIPWGMNPTLERYVNYINDLHLTYYKQQRQWIQNRKK